MMKFHITFFWFLEEKLTKRFNYNIPAVKEKMKSYSSNNISRQPKDLSKQNMQANTGSGFFQLR